MRLFFSPIAIPLLAGASTISYVSLLSTSIGIVSSVVVVFAAISLSCLVLCIGTAYLCNVNILLVLEKVFGLLLVMMSIQSLLTGIELFIKAST